MDFLEDWLTLYLTPGLGSGGCKKLIDLYGDPASVCRAPKSKLTNTPGLMKKVSAAINRTDIRDQAKRELEKCQKAGIDILSWDSAAFPEWLRNIPDPPTLLFVKGNPGVLSAPGIGIVGSRAASSYGLKMAGDLGRQLSAAGLSVISGLALGIDAAAHRGALANDRKTIAVLGCGLDIVYPAQNRDLFESIPASGAIVSEYPMGTPPDGFRFPARNRIISGLSLGVVVVEAAKRSGSLITAELALDQGREVFAVPGRADAIQCTCTHRRLQAGARLVLNVNDIICEVQSVHSPQDSEPGKKDLSEKDTAELTSDEKIVLYHLEVYPKTVDDVIVGSELSVEKVNELLLMLELKGFCEVLPGRQYQLKQ
ncbi:MAG: DNA-processing protein DprA [Thermodesulfobacteriota bacterium]